MISETLRNFDHALTVAELSKLLNLDRSTVYKLVRQGRLPHITIGSAVRFDPDAVADWIEGKQPRLYAKGGRRKGVVS